MSYAHFVGFALGGCRIIYVRENVGSCHGSPIWPMNGDCNFAGSKAGGQLERGNMLVLSRAYINGISFIFRPFCWRVGSLSVWWICNSNAYFKVPMRQLFKSVHALSIRLRPLVSEHDRLTIFPQPHDVDLNITRRPAFTIK